MTSLSADVAVIGSGFGGSIAALLLQRSGLRPVLLDRHRHPRFAIGESSTPVADLVLRDLARNYDLPRLIPLAKYGTWTATYPEVVCGLKRGFSYFRHEPGLPFVPRKDHGNELLVAASSDDERSDTHWLRSDVDAFLAREAESAGIPLFEEAQVELSRENEGWLLAGACRAAPLQIRAPFVIDATGEAGVVLKHLGVPDRADRLTTHSRALFAHFADAPRWGDLLTTDGADLSDHPFPCDNAALHQVFDHGWMWQLRFRNDVLSAGFAIDSLAHPLDPTISIDDEWARWMERSPSVEKQFRNSRIVAPAGGLKRTGRLQRRAAQAVGINWAALPNTAGFIDPLHSSGIAHTLCGIERLVPVLVRNWKEPERRLAGLKEYEATIFTELELVDRLVSGCYLARRHFPLLASFAMLYFAGATTYERRRLAASSASSKNAPAFLGADDERFCEVVLEAWQELKTLVAAETVSASHTRGFEDRLREAIAPYNSAGLLDPQARNMYRHTALPA